jgi:hypothetical protein
MDRSRSHYAADRANGRPDQGPEPGSDTAIYGPEGRIGPWTVQGALLLLGREDVVVPGDLRVRKAVQAAYRLDHLPTQQEVLAIADKWRPTAAWRPATCSRPPVAGAAQWPICLLGQRPVVAGVPPGDLGCIGMSNNSSATVSRTVRG